MLLYFAYGSNLSLAQMRQRCPQASLEGVAELRGYRLAFTRFSSRWGGGVADVVPDQVGSVWGLVYSLTTRDFEQLDGHEGYPHTYDRFQATVEGQRGRISGVWVYTVVDKRQFVSPTCQYLSIIQSAGEEFGFPEEYRRVLSSFQDSDPYLGRT